MSLACCLLGKQIHENQDSWRIAQPPWCYHNNVINTSLVQEYWQEPLWKEFLVAERAENLITRVTKRLIKHPTAVSSYALKETLQSIMWNLLVIPRSCQRNIFSMNLKIKKSKKSGICVICKNKIKTRKTWKFLVVPIVIW